MDKVKAIIEVINWDYRNNPNPKYWDTLSSYQTCPKIWNSPFYNITSSGWSGVAKVSCILRHWGIQLILAYSWTRPAILVVGKGRGGMFYFFCFFTFIPVPVSSLSLFFISSTVSSISFLPFSGRRHKMTHKGWCVVKPQHNQSNLLPLEVSKLLLHSTASDPGLHFLQKPVCPNT